MHIFSLNSKSYDFLIWVSYGFCFFIGHWTVTPRGIRSSQQGRGSIFTPRCRSQLPKETDRTTYKMRNYRTKSSGLIPDPLYFRMSQSPSDRPPAALTVTTSLAGLTSSWLNLALNADRLDEELSSKSAESLFIRLCEQISRIPDPELPKEDLPDIQIHKRKERFSYTWVHAGVHALVVRDGIWNFPKSISFLYRYLSFLFELPQKRRISFPVLLLPEN